MKHVSFLFLAIALLRVIPAFRNSRQIFYPDRPMVYTERAIPLVSSLSPNLDLKRLKSLSEILSPSIEEITFNPNPPPPSFRHISTSTPQITLPPMPVGVPLNLNFLPPPTIQTPSITTDVIVTPQFASTGMEIFGTRSKPMMPSASFSREKNNNKLLDHNKLTAATTNTRVSFSLPSYEGSVPGKAGDDFPVYDRVPITAFRCAQHQFPGYYGDVEAKCQVVHVCQADGRHDSFLCPNGTIFNQQYFVCDWWFNVDCSRTFELYNLNSKLYKQS